jgi:putative PIN family toxin of toxin-antitoxin system
VNERTRAVLDTNIFISAALRPEGPPGRLVRAFVENAAFELVLSAAIAEEVRRALAYPKLRKYLRRDLDRESWLEALLMLAEIVPGELELEGVCEDSDDDKFIAAALEGRAAFVVTGDRKLLVVSRYESIHIVGPRAFLDVLGL